MVPVDISLGSAIRRLEADLGLDADELAQALRVDKRPLEVLLGIELSVS